MLMSSLALITGESGWTGRNTGLDGKVKLALFPVDHGGSDREPLGRYFRFEIRADNGRFHVLPISRP